MRTSQLTRRQLLEAAGFLIAGSRLAQAAAPDPMTDWARNPRVLIAEAYNPPFYPSLDYKADKAVAIAKSLNADSLRYPAASYYAYFPTKSGYPIHPELKGDPFRETCDRCRAAGLKVIAYVPLNHPFMEVTNPDPRFALWTKKTKSGEPMPTEHYGFNRYNEGCLNSPVRDVIRTMVKEVLTQYPVDVMYFDGPYMGMQHAKDYCHCEHCEAAYRKKFGVGVPDQSRKLPIEDEIRYTNWLANDVVIAFLREIRELIRTTRDVPVLYNDTSLLSKREWRNRGIPAVDGFMFEAAETPEEKLFNMQLGQSTGKAVWTYVGTHTQYNREHMKSDRVRGWFSYPVESQELLLDGATAIAAGAGLVYWGLPRFFYQPEDPLKYESGRYVREVFDFHQKTAQRFNSLRSKPQAGVLVGDQTIDWFEGRHHVSKAYENSYHGAWQLLKANNYEAEPFLDWQLSPELLARYPMLYIPNAPCLSDAQCGMIRDYVRNGGKLLATHLTSVCDEYGRARKDYGLADLFGATLTQIDPLEIPDLYLKLPSGEEIPQDPQIVLFKANNSEVLAETIDRGHRKNLGPAIVRNKFGKGEVVYIGSSLEAVYEETRMKRLRSAFDTLVAPWLAAGRTYRVDYTPGVMPHYMASKDTIVLHLLADTGNKNKHLRVREEFVPVPVRFAVKIPNGRTVKSVTLLHAGKTLTPTLRDGWLEAAIPEVLIHEAVEVTLS